jgi:hypothetical protein
MGKHLGSYTDTYNCSCTKFCTGSRIKYIALTTVLVILALGAGFGIGYVIKKNKLTSCNPYEEGKSMELNDMSL